MLTFIHLDYLIVIIISLSLGFFFSYKDKCILILALFSADYEFIMLKKPIETNKNSYAFKNVYKKKIDKIKNVIIFFNCVNG